MPPIVLDQAPEVRLSLESLPPGPWALDTEFIRERTYHPQLALVQIAGSDGRILLIDPTVAGMGQVLAPSIAGCEALMHSASEDLQAFRHALGCLPSRLYDTQIAAAFAGYGLAIGYQPLVQQLLGIELAKAETRSNWLQRPLSAEQLEYAADDVRHLHELTAALDRQLDIRGHRERALADMARMLETARADSDDEQPHLGFRPAAKLDRLSQARLRRLLRWREQAARQRDLPKRWLLDNDLALELARRPPAQPEALAAQLAASRAARRLGAEIAPLLAAAIDADEASMPLCRELDRVDRDRLKGLQEVVAEVALRMALPDGLLCARKHLEALLLEPERWPAALDGWRREALETPLRRALAR